MEVRLPLISAMAMLAGCSDPAVELVGKATSPDGKRVIAAYYVVPGSILEEYLVLNVAPVDAPYSPDDSVISFAKVADLRAFWRVDGRPVVVAKSLEGSTLDSTQGLIACIESSANCADLRPRGRHIAIRDFETGGNPPVSER